VKADATSEGRDGARITILSVNSITAVRVFWAACVALFVSALVGLRWGAQISIALLPPAQRMYADRELLHGIWVMRSIFLFLLCALCGVLGIYFSVRASDVRER
jgi:hypothetical protein